MERFCSVFMDQMRGMFIAEKFVRAALPRECQHWFSGLSGILYILPVFSNSRRMTPLGKSVWFAQAVLSCLADFVFIGLSHPVHGIDRHFATLNCLFLLAIGAKSGMSSYLVTSVVPLGVHLAARIAQQDENWHLWVFLHGWWHITGPVLIYWFYNDEQIVYENRLKRGGVGGSSALTARSITTRSRSKVKKVEVASLRASSGFPNRSRTRASSRKRRIAKNQI
ncbi:hypothetical protein TrCOL_g3687 [Triparma columacea]|uniref:Uncharacterized protein n=1 Tax=Triparma columacea TaxID=722753 RepID=A0A9W7GB03_9STRA|nr:hypothetical protein TrCOL_g3687 [Triparma columacea]